MRTSGGDEVRAGDTYWLQGGIAASSMRPHPAGSPNKWGNKGLPFKTVVPGAHPISELHSQHSIRKYLLASYPFALCINIMPLVACYILPKYKEVEEGLSKSSVECSSNYKGCVSHLLS